MAARDSTPFEGFDEIQDPAAAVVGRSPSAQALGDASPPTAPSLTREGRRRRTILVLALALAWVTLIVLRLGIRG